jgi:hypothetical protein
LSRPALSEEIGCAVSSLERYENRAGMPAPDKMAKIISFLGYDPSKPAVTEK